MCVSVCVCVCQCMCVCVSVCVCARADPIIMGFIPGVLSEFLCMYNVMRVVERHTFEYCKRYVFCCQRYSVPFIYFIST